MFLVHYVLFTYSRFLQNETSYISISVVFALLRAAYCRQHIISVRYLSFEKSSDSLIMFLYENCILSHNTQETNINDTKYTMRNKRVSHICMYLRHVLLARGDHLIRFVPLYLTLFYAIQR